MKQYYKLFVFIAVLGFITSSMFVAMDLLFSAKIEENQNKAYYEAILTHNAIAYDDSNIFDVFDANITVETFRHNGKDVRVFTNVNNNNVSFLIGIFDLGGVWGDIIGVMTVDASFETLINVSVLQNEEQLGKDVSQRYFLDQFMNMNFDTVSGTPVISGPIGDNGDLPNEVDQLAGATNTSNAFAAIINESYFIYIDLLGVGA